MRKLLLFTLFALVVLAVLLPASPAFHDVPKRDPGVFLYMGQQIVEGNIPYRDMWDHKGPIIFYLNALGLLLGGGSQWGIWALELLSLATAVGLSYWLMRDIYNRFVAVAATVLWLISLGSIMVLERGNYTEEFALLLHFTAYFLFWRALKTGHDRWPFIGIGITLTLAFFLRANNIGAQLAIILFLGLTLLVTNRRRQTWRQLLYLALGAGVTLSLILLYFTANQALLPFLDAAFVFNFSYTETALQNRLEAALAGMSRFLPLSLTLTAVTGWLLGCRRLWRQRDWACPSQSFLAVLIIALPLEIYLATLSGQSFEHYFILWLPVFSLLTAFFFWRILEWKPADSHFQWPRNHQQGFRQAYLYLLIVLIVGLAFADSMRKLEESLAQLTRSGIFEQQPVIDYVAQELPPGSPLIFWGAEATMHFLTEQPSASRFVYQYPFYLANNYDKAPLIDEFVADLTRAKPWLIDTSPSNEKVPPLDNDARARWLDDEALWAKHRMQKVAVPPEMEVLYTYFAANYELVGSIEPLGWRVYQPVP